MALFSRVLGSLLGNREDEPMVDDQLGSFSAIEIPVQATQQPAYWGMSPTDIPYVTAQTQDEHNRLLNTFYPDRKNMKNWKEMGQKVEQRDPRYTDKDATTRKKLGAKSSVVQDMAFDKDKNLAWLKMGGQWYTYSATPDQFQKFLTSGSLGREMNRIKHDRSTSMNKTAARIQPSFVSAPANTATNSGGIFGRIGSLFGFGK